jgi:hypothetical protein
MKMDWTQAIARNLDALKRIVAMLVATVGMTAGTQGSATLPRHLHRFALGLLRPAEAAARRLIIVAASELVVDVRRWRPYPAKAAWLQGGVSGLRSKIITRVARPCRRMSLSLLDPLKRIGSRQRQEQSALLPRRGLLDSAVFNPQLPAPTPISPNDPLDAGRLHLRLSALAMAFEDLPAQANRMARWQARRDAVLAGTFKAANSERAASAGLSNHPSPEAMVSQAEIAPDRAAALPRLSGKGRRARRNGMGKNGIRVCSSRSRLRYSSECPNHRARDSWSLANGSHRFAVRVRDGP